MGRNVLMLVDPLDDFYNPNGGLPVIGADKDADRLAAWVRRNVYKIGQVRIFADAHHRLSIWHPVFWRNRKGNNPNPGDFITNAMINDGFIAPFSTKLQVPPFGTMLDYVLHYTKMLEKGRDTNVNYHINPEKYVLQIWPYHCETGKPGQAVFAPIMEALDYWIEKRFGLLDWTYKGTCWLTEHYSGIQAEVPFPGDASTAPRTDIIDDLANDEIDNIIVSGQALSHCCKFTLIDIINGFGLDAIKKIILLIDTMSPVVIPGVIDFTPQAENFVKQAIALGVRTAKSTDLDL